MKKITLLYIAAFLALTLGLMLSCAKKDGSSSSSSSEETDTSSSQSVTISTSLASEFGNAKFGDVKFQ
jgi:preprotein translocase subunit SecG